VCVCVCARVWQRGWLWVRQCCMLSEGNSSTRGWKAASGGNWDRFAYSYCSLCVPLWGSGMCEGNAHLAHLTGIYDILILESEMCNFFLHENRYFTCSHKAKMQQYSSVAFSSTLACLVLSERDVLFCEWQRQQCCHHFIFAVLWRPCHA